MAQAPAHQLSNAAGNADNVDCPHAQVTIPAAREDRPRREFGFVHFKERSSAVSVVESGETFTLDGAELNVRLHGSCIEVPQRNSVFEETHTALTTCGMTWDKVMI